MTGSNEQRTTQHAPGSVLVDLDRRYRTPLIRYFEKRVRENLDVEDMVQEVFLRLLKRSELQTVDNFEAYVFQIAASVINDRARRQIARRHAAHVPYQDFLDPGSEITPERVLLGQEAVKRVAAALQDLPERTRHVFVLRALEHRKFSDIAQLLRISTRATESHMAKALAYLAQVLENRDER